MSVRCKTRTNPRHFLFNWIRGFLSPAGRVEAGQSAQHTYTMWLARQKSPRHTSENDSAFHHVSATDRSDPSHDYATGSSWWNPWQPPVRLYLPEVVEDVWAPVGTLQKLDELADNVHLAVHHGNVKSSATETTRRSIKHFFSSVIWKSLEWPLLARTEEPIDELIRLFFLHSMLTVPICHQETNTSQPFHDVENRRRRRAV